MEHLTAWLTSNEAALVAFSAALAGLLHSLGLDPAPLGVWVASIASTAAVVNRVLSAFGKGLGRDSRSV